MAHCGNHEMRIRRLAQGLCWDGLGPSAEAVPLSVALLLHWVPAISWLPVSRPAVVSSKPGPMDRQGGLGDGGNDGRGLPPFYARRRLVLTGACSDSFFS